MADNPIGDGNAPAQPGSATRWLSYDEIAAVREIDRESAVRWARRKRWPRREANDGTVRLAVPEDILRRASNRGSKSRDILGNMSGDMSGDVPADVPGLTLEDSTGTIRALEDHVRTLRQELAVARQAAAEMPVLAERAGRAEAEAAALRHALAREVHQLEEAEAARKAAEATRDKAFVTGQDAAMRAMALEAERSRIKPQAERVPALVAELTSLREAQAREVRQREETEETLKAAEIQRDAAQKAYDTTQVELAWWTSGGPLARAWRAFKSRK